VTSQELPAFMDVFRGLQRVFPLRGEEHEIRDVGASYFKALRRFPLEQVQLGAEACLQRCKHFPKPAEWIDVVPRRVVIDLPTMSHAQAIEHRHAEQQRYEAPPCGCQSCAEAGVTEKALRFVPDADADGADRRMKDPLADRHVVAGHWAHGWELQRWYRARADFYNRCLELGLRGDVLRPTTKGAA